MEQMGFAFLGGLACDRRGTARTLHSCRRGDPSGDRVPLGGIANAGLARRRSRRCGLLWQALQTPEPDKNWPARVAIRASEERAGNSRTVLVRQILIRLVALVVLAVLWRAYFPSTFSRSLLTEGKLMPFGDGDFGSNDALGLLAYLLLMNPLLRVGHVIMSGLKLTGRSYDDSFIALAEPPLFWLGLLFAGLVVFDGVMSYACATESALLLCNLSPSRVTSISMALYVVILVNFVKKLFLRRLIGRTKNRSRRAEFVLVEKGLTTVTLVLLVVYAALILGVSTPTVVTYGGFSTLAFGFAAQHLIKDVYAGFMLYVFKPFMAGDDIRLPQYDKGGRLNVVEIGWLFSEMRLWDSSLIIVPNSLLFGNMVINATLKQYSYVTEVVHICYKDLGRLESLLQAMRDFFTGREEVAAEGAPPLVVVEKLDSSYVNVRMMVWLSRVSTRRRIEIASSLFIGVAAVIRNSGCDFAFPRLHISMEAETPESEGGGIDSIRTKPVPVPNPTGPNLWHEIPS